MRNRLQQLLNRGLPGHVFIDMTVGWLLLASPLLLIGQLLMPHPVWVTLLVVVVSLYALGYWWVRAMAGGLDLERRRQDALLVAGDRLQEEFTLINRSRFPVIWVEFDDDSTMPDYNPSRVVSTGAETSYRWRSGVECRRRGVFRLGPARLLTADLFGLFSLSIDLAHTQQALIYPRVLQLPEIALPLGQVGGRARRRRSLLGATPAASVRDYQPGDGLRGIHWRTTAHRGRLMVREQELEPSGDVWIVLDLNGRAHSGAGETSTLEYAIVLAASLAAALLDDSEGRSVGLLAVSGARAVEISDSSPWPEHDALTQPQDSGESADAMAPDDSRDAMPDLAHEALWAPPMPGQAQFWRILAALAPAEASDMPLADLLRRSGPALGRRRTLVVITADTTPFDRAEDVDGAPAWPAELARLQAAGLASSAFLVSALDGQARADQMRHLLLRLAIPAQILPVDAKLPPLLTYRRTRTVVRTTPTGGVITYEVEEEVS